MKVMASLKTMICAAAFGLGGIALSGITGPQPAEAGCYGSCPSGNFGEPTKYQRHVACNEAWRASPAYKQQQCKLRSVHWDSYHGDTGYVYMHVWRASTCWVHVECTYGQPAFPKSVHQGKIKLYDAYRLRRCKSDASQMNTTCAPLTTQHVEAGLADHQRRVGAWTAAIADYCAINDCSAWGWE